MILIAVLTALDAGGATVVSRGQVSPRSAPRAASGLNRIVPVATEPQPVTAETVAEPETKIENRSAQFGAAIAGGGESETSSLQQNIARLRAADEAAQIAAVGTSLREASANTADACDEDLRDCMTTRCGNNFENCATDGDQIWGGKMEVCRAQTKCTTEEFVAIAPEIKADRDVYSKLGLYVDSIKCGKDYTDCIFEQCGEDFTKCASKRVGDAAAANCRSIAENCRDADSGLESRAQQVFGILREEAEIRVRNDEEALYTLRDRMQESCKGIGALFDQRTLSCVYSVNFTIRGEEYPRSSKKLFPGMKFACTPEWFGVDVMTAKENAARLTEQQTTASSTALGSGIGTAISTFTSGGQRRAADTRAAENAVEEQEEKMTRQKCENLGSYEEAKAIEKSDEKLSDDCAKYWCDKNDPKSEMEECKSLLVKIGKGIGGAAKAVGNGIGTAARAVGSGMSAAGNWIGGIFKSDDNGAGTPVGVPTPNDGAGGGTYVVGGKAVDSTSSAGNGMSAPAPAPSGGGTEIGGFGGSTGADAYGF